MKLTFSVRKTGNGLAALKAKLDGKTTLVAGVLKGSTADVDDGKIHKTVPVAPYAAANEFGTEKIPPRPFLRTTFAAKEQEWRKAVFLALQRRGVDHPEMALRDVGGLVRGDIVATIRTGHFTPLSPKTIEAKRRKGRPEPETPLIDTGSLIRSVAYEVRKR